MPLNAIISKEIWPQIKGINKTKPQTKIKNKNHEEAGDVNGIIIMENKIGGSKMSTERQLVEELQMVPNISRKEI